MSQKCRTTIIGTALVRAAFPNAAEAYLVEVAPLQVSGKADILLEDYGIAGQGKVFALGDSWIYNKYIDHKQNREIATNLFRVLLQ
jgi:hypothetical protein